jgi:adenosine/AMP kinase
MKNIKIDKQKNKIEILLNKEFYSVDVVKQTIKDFSEVCDCNLDTKNNIKIVLSLKNNKDIEIMGYEFCNYVIGLMKNEAIV